MSSQLEDVEKSKRELTRLINELTDKMSTQFREQFTKINANFNDTFRELFGGGKADLILEDEEKICERLNNIFGISEHNHQYFKSLIRHSTLGSASTLHW